MVVYNKNENMWFSRKILEINTCQFFPITFERNNKIYHQIKIIFMMVQRGQISKGF